ncbi:MAG: NigD-like C-terminal domain-containing protein [Breznakibacter sp.]
MKKILFIMLLGLGLSLTGCLKDDDTTQYYGFGIVQPSTSGLWILTDDNHVLYGASGASTIEAGSRVYFLYSIVKEGAETDNFDYHVKWDDVYKVLTKNIFVINEVSRDTIGSDAVRVNNVWLAKNYLNVDLTYWGYSKTHYFNLVYDEESQTEPGAVVLELKHKDNDDAEVNGYWGLVSFDLNSFDWTGTPPHKIKFKFKDYYSVVQSVDLSYTPPTEQ